MDDPNAIGRLLSGLPTVKLTRPEENRLATIVQRFKTGARRTEALDRLVLHAMRDAFFYSRRCCGAQLPPDDIYSLCYQTLCRVAHNFAPNRQAFFAFAKPYLRGALIRFWRKMTREVTVAPSADPTMENVLDSVGVEPEFENIRNREQWAMIAPLISRLPAKDKALLRAYYVRGKTFAAIARSRGVTREAVRIIHDRILRRLRNRLLSRGQLYTT